MFFGPLIRMSQILGSFSSNFERPQSKRLVEDLVDQPLAFVAIEQRVFRVAKMLDDQADFAPQRVAFELAHLVQIELVDQLAVDPSLEFFEFLVLGGFRQSLNLS